MIWSLNFIYSLYINLSICQFVYLSLFHQFILFILPSLVSLQSPLLALCSSHLAAAAIRGVLLRLGDAGGLVGYGWSGSTVIEASEAFLQCRLSRILSLKFLALYRSVLVKELVNVEPATTNTNMNLISLFQFHSNALGTELVDTLLLSHEHDLQLITVRVVVDVLCQLLVDHIALLWDVYSDTCLKIDNVLTKLLTLTLQAFDIRLVVLHLTKHVQLLLLWLEEFLLKLIYVGWCTF